MSFADVYCMLEILELDCACVLCWWNWVLAAC